MRWTYGESSLNLWRTGGAFFSSRFNVGVYLFDWAWPRVFVLPGSTYCLGGTVNYELGPLRVVWVRAYNPSPEVATYADEGLHDQNHRTP